MRLFSRGPRVVGMFVCILGCVLAACSPLGYPSANAPTATPTQPTATPTATPIPLPPTVTPVPPTATPVISANCQDAIGERGRILDRNGNVLAYSVKDPLSPGGWRRRYTVPSLSNVIGYFSPIYGVTGLEKYYDQTLSGQSAQDCGADVYLSIDVRIQKEIEQAFDNNIVGGLCLASNTGSVIVEDPRNGQILAMLSEPYFNADTLGDMAPAPDNPKTTVAAEYWNSLQENTHSVLLDRPLQGLYPPGSSFKTLTLSAAIDNGNDTLHTQYSQAEATSYTVNGFLINSNNLDAYTYGPEPPSFPLDLQHAYAYSDNVVFARVGTQIGANTLTNYAARFALSTPGSVQPVPIDTDPAATSPSYLYENGSLDPVTLATTAFGQGQLFLTPLTMEMITSAVAANGTLYAPRFAWKIVPHDGKSGSVAPIPPVSLGQVMSSQTAQAVRAAMHDVVTYGSVGASGGIIANVMNSPSHIGGKTGTAQLPSGSPHGWFISLAPDDAYPGVSGPAHLAVVVMRERGGEGACQAPIARTIIDYALPLVP
jgi:peptidoglycan glycosyltransferase